MKKCLPQRAQSSYELKFLRALCVFAGKTGIIDEHNTFINYLILGSNMLTLTKREKNSTRSYTCKISLADQSYKQARQTTNIRLCK